MTKNLLISRLAPTPSGYLHLGNLMNFTITWSLIRRQRGQLYLRIDDGDVQRTRDEYRQDIEETLHWLGFEWDKVLPTQSSQTESYWQWLQHLPHYACDCSRKSLEARGVMRGYDGFCRSRNLPYTAGLSQLRLHSHSPQNDLVIWRKENLPAYQLACVVDDLQSGVNLIVRGEDLRESSEFQKEIAQLAGKAGSAFHKIKFIHHPLLVGPEGEKLSKSKDDLSLKAMRESGKRPKDIFKLLGQQLKLGDETESLQDFLKIDWNKMDWA